MSLELDKKIITIFLMDGSLFSKYLKELDEGYFIDPYVKIFKVLKSYYIKFKKLPSFDFFEEALFKRRDQIFPGYELEESDKEIASFRGESTFIETADLEFLIDEIKKRYIWLVIEKQLPSAIQDIKQGDLKGISQLQTAVNAMNKATVKEGIQHSSNHDYIDEVLEKYNQTKQSPLKAWGVKLGFHALDAATFGIAKGEMFIVAGRHGAGKSVFLLSAALNAFRNGKNVIYVSLEMPTEQMWHRVGAAWTGLPVKDIIEGTLDDEKEQLYLEQMEAFKNSLNRFEVIDCPHVTVPTISSELDLIVDKYAPDLLVVDYLGIIRPTDSKLSDNLAQASVVEEMRALARLRKIALFTAVQLNRDPGKSKVKTKGTERLSRSDTIGATADVVLQLDEMDVEESATKLSDRTKIFMTKNRKGPQITFEVRRDFKCTRFLDWDPGIWNKI